MIIKAMTGVFCVLAVACGGAAQAPMAHVAALESCPGGAVHSAAELAAYRGCGLIEGDLTVNGVSSLAALSDVHAITGSLTISDTARLSTLAGLEQLQTVSRLELRRNAALRSVSELARLHQAHTVAIEGNPELRNLDGFTGLSKLESLSVRQTGLYSLHGLENLLAVGVLEIKNNSELIDPSALNGVAQASNVVVGQNPRLCSHFGFLAGIQRPGHAALSGNIGLDRSSILRFQESKTQATIAAR